MTPTLRTAYWHDPAARQSFRDFILRIHGVDFSAWDSAGYWDDDYKPYSYFMGERLVASLCIYAMPALVNGRVCDVVQVSGVGTLPEYRLQGLNRRLHELAAQAPAKHRFAFLYADEDAVPFYRKCGFRPVSEVEFRFPVDRLDTPPGQLRELAGHNVHVMGDFDLGPQPVLPFTSQA